MAGEREERGREGGGRKGTGTRSEGGREGGRQGGSVSRRVSVRLSVSMHSMHSLGTMQIQCLEIAIPTLPGNRCSCSLAAKRKEARILASLSAKPKERNQGMANTGSAISTARTLIEGTAYILYGRGPCDLTSFADLDQDSWQRQDPNQENEQNRLQSHLHHHQHDHDHDHGHDHDPPKHFWAIFHPEKDTLISSDGTVSTTSTKGNIDAAFHLFLSGTPHAWGSFPPEMPAPHGCIPPHLYYKVNLLRPRLKSSTATNDLNTEGGRDQIYDFQEHTIPFVHRFGDNKDDAGGLTTAYHLLEKLESADDYGAFMDELIHVFQSASVASSTNSQDKNRVSSGDLPRSSTGALTSQVALYACTEVLFSDTKTRQLIHNHFFSSTTKMPLPPSMMQFVNHCYEYSESTEPSNAPRILKSDLKILLPVDDPLHK